MDYTNSKYLAGYLDGDGSLSLMCRKVKDNYYLSVDVRVTGSKDSQPVLEIFKELYGGNIYRDPKRDNVLQWYTNEAGSVRLLEQTKNHMVLKRPVANFLLRFFRNRTKKKFSKSEKKEIMSQLTDLRNTTGSDKPYLSLPWLAGYIDSDGCFHKNTLQFNTHSRCIPALALIQKAFGGSIQISKAYYAHYTLYVKNTKIRDVIKHLKLKKYNAEQATCND